jgi:glycosyltransferase involved in cell wall biosynthesis
MTMLISIITPVHGPSIRFLPDAYASLSWQDLPDGRDWQWLVQEDGSSGAPADVLPDDPRISFGTGRALGQGVARTLALSRAGGEYIKVLDSDDQLTRGALGREIEVCAAVHPATLCMRRSLVFALGGWMALPAGEDTGLLLAADAVTTGYFIGEPGLYYRKWPGQVTADLAHSDPGEWRARNRVIEERARILASGSAVSHPDGRSDR